MKKSMFINPPVKLPQGFVSFCATGGITIFSLALAKPLPVSFNSVGDKILSIWYSKCEFCFRGVALKLTLDRFAKAGNLKNKTLI